MDILEKIDRLNEATSGPASIPASQLPDWAKKAYRKIMSYQSHKDGIKNGTHVMVQDGDGGVRYMSVKDFKVLKGSNWKLIGKSTISEEITLSKEDEVLCDNTVKAALSEGETKEALWMPKHKELRYFNSRNTSVVKSCDSIEKAKAYIKASGIEQTLKIQK